MTLLGWPVQPHVALLLLLLLRPVLHADSMDGRIKRKC
jgi:hypothetical protein